MSFRITQSMIASNTLSNLQSSLGRTQKLQDQMSSGKILSKPSDDPSGVNEALQYRSDIKRAEQYSRNADDGVGWLGLADNTITSTLEDVDRVRVLLLQAANGTSDETSRKAISDEISTLKAGMISQANMQYDNRPIFAGTANTSTAFLPDGTYNGNSGSVYRTVGADASVQVNMTGEDLYGSGSASLFKVLDDINAHLAGGTEADINALTNGATADLARLDAARVNMQNRHAEVGARYHRVETMQALADNSVDSLKSNLSKVEDADLPATYVALSIQNTAYQAALAATAKVIQPSLVDFLS